MERVKLDLMVKKLRGARLDTETKIENMDDSGELLAIREEELRESKIRAAVQVAEMRRLDEAGRAALQKQIARSHDSMIRDLMAISPPTPNTVSECNTMCHPAPVPI